MSNNNNNKNTNEQQQQHCQSEHPQHPHAETNATRPLKTTQTAISALQRPSHGRARNPGNGCGRWVRSTKSLRRLLQVPSRITVYHDLYLSRRKHFWKHINHHDLATKDRKSCFFASAMEGAWLFLLFFPSSFLHLLFDYDKPTPWLFLVFYLLFIRFLLTPGICLFFDILLHCFALSIDTPFMQCSTFCFSISSYSSIIIFVLPQTFLFPLPLPYFGYCGVRSSQALQKSKIVPLPLINSEFPSIVKMWWCDDCGLRSWLVLLASHLESPCFCAFETAPFHLGLLFMLVQPSTCLCLHVLTLVVFHPFG